jgi:hypothetical protein
MYIPKHVREEIIELLPYLDFDDYLKFATQYFTELVALGVFLSDVKFINLTLKAQRIVLFGAYRLWITREKEKNAGIM